MAYSQLQEQGANVEPLSTLTSKTPASTSATPNESIPPQPNPLIKKRFSFTDYFWSSDYQDGVNVLFDKLEQGISENAQLLDFVSCRISLESAYASNLASAVESISNSRNAILGFNRDEGASTKQTFVSFLDESSLQSETHERVASVLEKSVRAPFAAFANDHKKNITLARSSLTQSIKNYHKTVQKTKKAKESYYAKASQLEELTNSSVPVAVTSSNSLPLSSQMLNINKGNVNHSFSNQQKQHQQQSTASFSNQSRSSTLNSHKYTIIGGREYDKPSLYNLLDGMMTNIPREVYKIPIIGSYENVSSGENILHYIRTSLDINNLGFAEEYGQSLVDNGFLRLVGAIGNTFSGTTNSKYQWLPKAITLASMGDNDNTGLAPTTNTNPPLASSSSSSTTRSNTEVSPNPLSSASSTLVTAAETSLDEAASKMAKRTSQIISGYFSNLRSHEEEGSTSNVSRNGFSSGNSNHQHRRQSSIPSGFNNDTFNNNNYHSGKKGHSRTLSTISNSSYTGSVALHHEPQISKLQREVMELDVKYQECVELLDHERCLLEQRIYETLSSVQLCERERLKQVKFTLSAFTSTAGASVPALHQSFQRMGMHSEHIDPQNDLDYLIERYKTGPFCPKPVVYLGFFGNSRKQSFGVDLKYVPFIIGEFVKYIADEKHVLGSPTQAHAQLASYPKAQGNQIEDSESSDSLSALSSSSSEGEKYMSHLTSSTSRDVLASLWSDSQSPLAEIQELRQLINTGAPFSGSVAFPRFSLQVIISTLREILLELPDNIISYDAMKAMYAKQATPSSTSPSHDQNGSVSSTNTTSAVDDVKEKAEKRISEFVKLLGILGREDLSALKVLIYHFADVCEVTNKSTSGTSQSDSPKPIHYSDSKISPKVKTLAKAMAPYLVRPRVVTALTMTDKHPTLVLQDLILYHEQIFSGIDARTTKAHESRRRSRSPSGSEANRRFNIEERNKAIVAAAYKNGGGAGMTPSMSMSKLLNLNTKASSPGSSNNNSGSTGNRSASNSISGSAPNSPPRNGPLPLTLSSHIRTKNLSLGSNNTDDEYGMNSNTHASPFSYSGDNGYGEGLGYGYPLSGSRGQNGSFSNLNHSQARGTHRESSSTSKRLSMSFLDPPIKNVGANSGFSSRKQHSSQSSIGSTGSVTSSGSSHSSNTSSLSRAFGNSSSVNGTPKTVDSPGTSEVLKSKYYSDSGVGISLDSQQQQQQHSLSQSFPAIEGIVVSDN